MSLLAAGAPSMAVQTAVGAAVMAAILGANVLYCRAAGRTVDQWAARHGLHLLNRRFGWFATGPFRWLTARGNTHFGIVTHFRIVAEDAEGRVRRGWVRCHGLAADFVDARWDTSTDPAASFPVVPVKSGGRNDGR